MLEELHAAILGLVEGLTEFLPVSSTGHLILTTRLLGFDGQVGKEVADTFNIFIQLGAILAIIAVFPGRFGQLFRFRENRGFSGLRGAGLLAVTSIPGGLLGLLAGGAIKERLFNPTTVAIGLAVGAVWILAVERFLPKVRRESVDDITWTDAVGIGLFQCLALWPGMSRSSSTILGAMMLGVGRRAATEYSFFAAVPLLAAATLYDLLKSLPHLHTQHVPLFAVGFAVAFVSAWLAVRLFVRFVGRHTLAPFGWYRLAVAGLAFWYFANK